MSEWNQQVQEIIDILGLRLNPQAVKMIENEAEIPANCMRASQTTGHLAFCQAQALAKRDGRTVYMDKNDHWCWGTLVGFGMVDCSPSSPAFDKVYKFLGAPTKEIAAEMMNHFPKLPQGKYIGTVVGPATQADYTPDVLLFNTDDNFQFRTLVWGIKNVTGQLVQANFDGIDSCVHTVVSAMVENDFQVAIPDPGEQERAFAGSNEIILAVPFDKLNLLYNGVKSVQAMHSTNRMINPAMEYDYPRPSFYNRLFEEWGLETGKEFEIPGM